MNKMNTYNQESLKKQPTTIKNTPRPTQFNHIEFFKEIKDNLVSYKLTELKEIAKYNKIKGAKTKPEYMAKIHDFFTKTLNAVKIQKVCRGFFVRLFFNVKGGMENISRCVNENDFYTLEPLNDIHFTKFFIIKETNNESNTFYYGFNILSLITMYRKNESILNPYNRQSLPIETIQNIFTHYQLLFLLFKETVLVEDTIENIIRFKVPSKYQIRILFGKNDAPATLNANTPAVPTRVTRSTYRAQIDNTIPPMTLERLVMEEILFPSSGVINTYIIRNYTPMTQPSNQLLEREQEVENNVAEGDNGTDETEINHQVMESEQHQEDPTVLENIRNRVTVFKQQPINTRINELFMYIDQLGNYTNASWFSGLNKRKYYIFYSQLRELWTFRAQIPNNVKSRICPFGDPFLQSSAIFRKPYDQITDDEIIEGCLDVIENIILTSTDIEYRKIGCLHALTALTVVSPESRLQYGYLYDLVDSMPLQQHTRFSW